MDSSNLSSSDSDTSREWTDFITPKKRRCKSTVHGLNRRRAEYYRSKSQLKFPIQGEVGGQKRMRQLCDFGEAVPQFAQGTMDIGDNTHHEHESLINVSVGNTNSDISSDVSSDSLSLSTSSLPSSSSEQLSSDDDAFSEDFEANKEYQNETLKDESRDFPIFEGCPHSKTSLYTMLMLYAIKHSLSKEAFSDLILLVKSLFPPTCTLKMSVYKIKDQLRKSVESKQPTVHFYCETCQIEIPAGENRCQHCDESSVLEYHNLDVEQQIKDLFKDEHFCKLVMKERESSKDGQLADIRDGSEYRKLLCDQSDFQPSNTVQLSFLLNTDGVAVYSSSKKGSLWPVYLAINELPIALRFSRRYLLPCLLFCQSEKPNMLTYLASLMQTLDSFQKGIEIDTFLGKKFVKGLLLAVCVDLPARAMVLNMKQFNGKYGCNVCHAEGETLPNCPLHRYYPVGESSQRTHKSMVNDVRTAVQSGQAVRGMKGGSALLALKHVDLSKICPIDWMHCVLLGVVKALMKLWLCPLHKNRSFYIGDKIALMDRRLLHIQVPDFIARRPSSIAEHAHWKATECREWLIHFSIPVLRGLLKYPVSVHYFLLVYAMSLLTKEVVTLEDISVAEDMLTDFCTVFPDIYGIAKQSMNIHMLTHLPHFVRLFGPLWNFSCFGFESMNAHLKSMIHGTRHINHQISCAISMTRSLPGLVKNIIKRTESDDTKRLAKLLSSKITMGEKDDEKQDAQVLGKRRQLKADDPTVEQFQLHGLVHKFFRCATDKGHHLWSAEYQRCKIRNSYTISFIYNDATRYGSILYFIDNEDKLFAVVKLFNVSTLGPDGDFSLVSERLQKYRGMIFKHIILVTDSKEEILLPVDHIRRKCIQIGINNVMYIAIPPNQFEHN